MDGTITNTDKVDKIRSIVRGLIIFFVIAAIFAYSHNKSVENYRNEIKSCYDQLEPYLHLQAEIINNNKDKTVEHYDSSKVNLSNYLIK